MFSFSKKNIPFHKLIPKNYVDFHSHLMPEIDDGVKTVYQSAYILEQFENLGVQKIITTPHIMQDVYPNTTAVILQKLQEMRKAIDSLGFNITLETAAEYMMDDLFFQRLKQKDLLTIKEKYILVEMSTFSAPINLSEILFEIKVSEYTPILAHPERYTFYFNKFNTFGELKESGFLFQLNLLSMSGYYGEHVQRIAIKLLNEGLYDFVGSDIHNRHQFESLEKGFSKKYAKKIVSIMEKNSLFL